MRQYIRRKSLQLLPCLDRRRRRRQSRQQRRNSNENQGGTGEQNIELIPQQPLPQPEPATDEPSTDTPQPVQNEHNPAVDPEILPEAPAATDPELTPEASSDGQSEVSFTSNARRRLEHFVLTETPAAAADPQPRSSTQRITRSRSKTPAGDAASRSPIRKQRGRRSPPVRRPLPPRRRFGFGTPTEPTGPIPGPPTEPWARHNPTGQSTTPGGDRTSGFPVREQRHNPPPRRTQARTDPRYQFGSTNTSRRTAELESPIESTERILDFAPEFYPETSAAHNATSQPPNPDGDGTSGSPPRGPRGRIHFAELPHRDPAEQPPLSGDSTSEHPPRRTKRGRRAISPVPGPESRTKKPGEESPEEGEATRTARFRRKGTNYQDWIDRANDADCQIPCPIQRSTLRWNDIVRNPDKARRWDIGKEKKVGPNQVAMKDHVRAPGLATGENDYRQTQISRLENAGYNLHTHRMGPGVIFAEFCQRPVGSVNPHWSEIALAQYQRDYDIDTLRYVYVVDCENTETLGHMRDVLFPRLGYSKDSQEVLTWEYNTQGYKEIMGVVWGKGVGALVLGAWDRGTHRIARILTWQSRGNWHMRFDIEVLRNSPRYDLRSLPGKP